MLRISPVTLGGCGGEREGRAKSELEEAGREINKEIKGRPERLVGRKPGEERGMLMGRKMAALGTSYAFLSRGYQ